MSNVFKRKMQKKKLLKSLEEYIKNTPESELWKPPSIGEKRDDEVTVYAVAIPNLATPVLNNTEKEVADSKKAVALISGLAGLVGIYPCYPKGTLILFKTENDAKRGRNLMEADGIQTGSNISKVYVDKKYVEGK